MALELQPIKLEGVPEERPMIIAGPCSAETEEQVMSTAKLLSDNGVKIFRAGIWKPRTKPGGFEGIGVDGLAWLKEVKKETKNRIRIISWILFVIYIGLLVYFLFLSEEYGRTSFDQRIYRYNLTPFQEIKRFWIYRHRVGFWVAFLNLAGNVIGFLPFGFFLPILSRRLRNGAVVTALGFGLSLLVESIQLVFKVGCFDVDDLILNTLGVLLGYLSFWICNGIRRMIYEKKI